MARSNRFELHPVAVTGYLFALSIIYLAAAYLGGTFPYIFAVFSATPLVSLTLTRYLWRGLVLRIDTLAPTRVRGERMPVSGEIRNYRSFPVSTLRVWIRIRQPGSSGETAEHRDLLSVTVGRQSSRRFLREIACDHRGDYELQFGPAEMRDPLGWITFRRDPVVFRFHVFPRILTLDTRRLVGRPSDLGQTIGSGRSNVADTSRFRGLAGYREGMPVRHIAWKKFAAHGRPYIKEYDSAVNSGVAVYLDLRPPAGAPATHATTEDHVLETVVAVMRRLLDGHIPVDFFAIGASLIALRGAGPYFFDEFYHFTRKLVFNGHVSPVSLVDRHIANGDLNRPALIIVSHRIDDELLAMPLQNHRSHITCDVILSATTWSTEDQERARRGNSRTAASLLQGGIYVVQSIEQLEEGVTL